MTLGLIQFYGTGHTWGQCLVIRPVKEEQTGGAENITNEERLKLKELELFAIYYSWTNWGRLIFINTPSPAHSLLPDPISKCFVIKDFALSVQSPLHFQNTTYLPEIAKDYPNQKKCAFKNEHCIRISVSLPFMYMEKKII